MTTTVLRFDGVVYNGVLIDATDGENEFPLVVFTVDAEAALRGASATLKSIAIADSIMAYIPINSDEIPNRIKNESESLEVVINEALPDGISIARPK